MSLFCPSALIFFVFWCPGAPIFDALGLLFGFRGALGALIAAPLVSLEGCRKKLAPQCCIAGPFWWKMAPKRGPKKKVPIVFWAHFGDLFFSGTPLDAKIHVPAVQYGKINASSLKIDKFLPTK